MKMLLVFLCGLSSSSCSVVRPDGALDDLLAGDLFAGPRLREGPRPPVYASPPPIRGPVRWRIDF